MEEIAEESGLALGTVYAVFRGKSAIVDALHQSRLGELIQTAQQAAEDSHSPLDRLVAGVRAVPYKRLGRPLVPVPSRAEQSQWAVRLARAEQR